MVRALLIAGIDPGTTTAFAALDTEGRIMHVGSAKGLGLNHLVAEFSRLGRVIAVGTDKKKLPLLIQKFAARTGARIITPKEDLGTKEKDSIDAANGHQKDAIAAAYVAYKELKPLLIKIRVLSNRQQKQDIIKEVTEKVIIGKIGITKIIRQITEQNKK
jgi:predicted RNase H-like nuclease (RuvC/YqgF family)